MKYFLDTEFIEGSQKKRFLGIPVGNSKPTIELISIGIVSEDNKRYYAICKDFNLREAWNWYDLKDYDLSLSKDYWIRNNVLYPIYMELWQMEKELFDTLERMNVSITGRNKNDYFSYGSLKRLLKRFGKTREKIAAEVQEFVYDFAVEGYPEEITKSLAKTLPDIHFYTYYGDYDWVVFCWLFGKMKDLPVKFPKYSRDLKQMFDELVEKKSFNLKNSSDYPVNKNEHTALGDALWNRDLYNFMKRINM